jgi:hypothetical protein
MSFASNPELRAEPLAACRVRPAYPMAAAAPVARALAKRADYEGARWLEPCHGDEDADGKRNNDDFDLLVVHFEDDSKAGRVSRQPSLCTCDLERILF